MFHYKIIKLPTQFINNTGYIINTSITTRDFITDIPYITPDLLLEKLKIQIIILKFILTLFIGTYWKIIQYFSRYY